MRKVRTCSLCSGKHYARRFCRKHYDQKRFAGALSLKHNTRGMSITKRLAFYSKPNHATGCIVWTGSTVARGYGNIRIDGTMQRTHRVAYKIYIGDIPDGMSVLHRCDNPPCINPNHLFVGTTQDNSDDMLSKGRGVFMRGEQHGCAKLTRKTVRQIKRGTMGQRKIAAKYGISQTHVGRILRGESWTPL